MHLTPYLVSEGRRGIASRNPSPHRDTIRIQYMTKYSSKLFHILKFSEKKTGTGKLSLPNEEKNLRDKTSDMPKIPKATANRNVPARKHNVKTPPRSIEKPKEKSKVKTQAKRP